MVRTNCTASFSLPRMLMFSWPEEKRGNNQGCVIYIYRERVRDRNKCLLYPLWGGVVRTDPSSPRAVSDHAFPTYPIDDTVLGRL